MTDVAVISEPHTYEQHLAGVSFFRDLALRDSDTAAQQRLERHAREVELERRTNPSRIQGQGGYFAPPLWAIDQFATAPRPQRVLANMIARRGNRFPMPQGVQSINIPRLTTGTVEFGTGDDAADNEQDVVDASLTSPVVTISGAEDTSLQLLEQSPTGAHFDMAMFRDLSQAYDMALETMLINGSGPQTQPTEQFLGLMNLPNTLGVTFTNASPTATLMFTFLGQMISRIGNNRKCPPEAWLMTTSRAAWLGSSEDSQQRPLMIADNTNANGSFDLLAFQVGMSDAVPTNLAGNPGSFTSNGTQDVIIACRPSDMLLFESQPTISTLTEVLSGTLQVRFVYRAYAAFICRYPSGVAILGGTGLAVQSGFTN